MVKWEMTNERMEMGESRMEMGEGKTVEWGGGRREREARRGKGRWERRNFLGFMEGKKMYSSIVIRLGSYHTGKKCIAKVVHQISSEQLLQKSVSHT